MNYSDVFVDVTKHARKIPTSEYQKSGKYPIIDQGQKQIAGYTDIEEGLFTDVPAIIFGDHTRIIKYIDTPFFIGADGVKVIKCLDKGADYKYCYYLLKSARIPDTGYNRHYKWLKESVFPKHNKQQQKQIVDTLTTIDKLMCKYTAETNKLDELIKSRFVEMFGDCNTNPQNWKTVPIENIANVGSSKRVFVEELKNEGIPFFRGTEVGALAESKSMHPELFITEEHYQELINESGQPKRGDLLMPSICPDGRIWLVNTDSPFYFKDGRVLWIHDIIPKINPTFLLYTLKDRIMTDYSSIASGTTFAELKIFALKKCKIFDVPIDLQNKFESFILSVNQQKATVQKSIDKLETLKKSLMQEYFG